MDAKAINRVDLIESLHGCITFYLGEYRSGTNNRNQAVTVHNGFRWAGQFRTMITIHQYFYRLHCQCLHCALHGE